MIKEQIRVRVCVCVLLEKISETSSRQCKQCEEWKGSLWRWDYNYEKILTILSPSICTKGQLEITLSRQIAMLTPPTPPPHKVWSSKICTHKNVFLLNDIENSHRFQYACTFAVVTEIVREKSIYRCIFFSSWLCMSAFCTFRLSSLSPSHHWQMRKWQWALHKVIVCSMTYSKYNKWCRICLHIYAHPSVLWKWISVLC